MADGRVFKRCYHDGREIETGKPATARRRPVPACPCDGGSWWWRVSIGRSPVTGRRIQRSRSGYATKAAAKAGLHEFLEQVSRGGGRVDDRGRTVAAWMQEWLDTGTWKTSTRRSYTADVNRWIIPKLGHIRLRDLGRGDVREMLAEVARRDDSRTDRGEKPGRGRAPAAQLAGGSVDRVRRTLRAALSAAVEEELIRENYARGRFRAIPKRAKPEEATWTDAQVQQFLASVADDQLASMWWFVATTGARRGEACGLRWVDVDLVSDTPGAVIRQTVVASPGPHICPVCPCEHTGRFIQQTTSTHSGAKTSASTGRWVPLSSDVVRELVAHQASQEARRQELGVHHSDHGLVWSEDDGAPLRPDWVTKRHGDLIGSAGLPKVKLHGMRHTLASQMSTTTASTAQIGLMLGHGHDSEQITLLYTHAQRAALAASVEEVSARFRAAK